MGKNREEEYLRRMKERGYVPSLAGMDDEDIEWELDRMGRGQEGSQPMETMLNKAYQPVDRDFAERIFKMFARPFDPKWQMPNLDGPEYRQPQRESRSEIWPQPSRGNAQRRGEPAAQTMELRFGRGDAGKPALSANMANGGQGDGDRETVLTSIDPLGMFPQYGAQNRSSGKQTDSAPTAEHPQYLWDEHIWKSPEVIGAQTPKDKREE